MEKLVVIGAGMAGNRLVEELLRSGDQRYQITIIGAEPYPGYNRIQLSEVLEGQMAWNEIITNSDEWYRQHQVEFIKDDPVASINRRQKAVQTQSGKKFGYDKLVIATGSHPFILPVPGSNLTNVLAFRTIADGKQMETVAKHGGNAVIIGGGMEGLEAAAGLKHQGMAVTVVELADHLMPNALDKAASKLLRKDLEDQGISFRLSTSVTSIAGSTSVTGVKTKDGEELSADLVVMCLGIRPNIDIAKQAGLDCDHGIKVIDYLQTSDTNIYAIGECAEWNGQTIGIVAPCYQQAGIVAKVLTGDKAQKYRPELSSMQLKVPGIDLFSAGQINNHGEDNNSIKALDDVNRNYERVFVNKDDEVVGVILYGDVTDSNRDFLMIKKHKPVDQLTPFSVLVKRGVAVNNTSNIADEMDDNDIVCGCNNITKGQIIKAIHDKNLSSVAEVGKATRAGTSCGKCKPIISAILKAELGDKAQADKDTLCSCTDLGHDEIMAAIKKNHWTTSQQVMEGLHWKRKGGCNKCRPALNLYLSVCFPHEHKDEKPSRWANERYLANIQKDGTYSVVPRMTGGATTADQLIAFGKVAKKYHVPMVKVVTSQRLGMYGVKREDLPAIWKDLHDLGGMESSEGYEQSLRETKACVSKDWCRFGTIDCAHLAQRIEDEFKEIDSPKKLKLGVSGCPRSCAESLTKDFGVIGYGGQYRIYIGGNNGTTVHTGKEVATVKTEDEVLEYFGAWQQWFRENGHYGERTWQALDREGWDTVIGILNDDEKRQALYNRDIDARSAYREQHLHKGVWQDAYESKQMVNDLFTSKDITLVQKKEGDE